MHDPGLILIAVLVIGLMCAIGLLSSRNLAEYLVRHGMLPRSFLQLTPIFVSGTRWLAAILIVLGLGRAAAVAGLFSAPWIEHYGVAILLVLGGVVLLWMSYRRGPPRI